MNYGEAILSGFEYLLKNYPDVFVIGQGLWSPWYVGNSMNDLDKNFGKSRVIDTPVSEAGCTGVGVGASLSGMRPIVVHPRMDFMLYGIDPIVNQAAKWSHMFGGQANAPITIRAIINRGGEQGAQHSQALHSWFAHIPGLRVVMPATVSDARDLLIESVLSDDPVLYIDDRWLYENEAEIEVFERRGIETIHPKCLRQGKDVTIVASGYSSHLAMQAAEKLSHRDILAEVIDVRVLSPLSPENIIKSVLKTRRLVVIDGSWKNCGFSAEVVASVSENIDPHCLFVRPLRITLPESPAPTSKKLQDLYYPTVDDIAQKIEVLFSSSR